MKKQFIILVFIFAPLLLTAQSFEFNKKGNLQGWRFGGCTIEVTNGKMEMNMTGDSKNSNIRRSKIKAENAQYMHVVLKNNSNVEKLLFNFKDDEEKKVFIPKEISVDDKEMKTYTFYLAEQEQWIGVRFPNLRFSIGSGNVSGKIEIDRIVFSNNSSL